MSGFPTGLEEFRRRLDEVGRATGGQTPEELVQDLETAYEELRAADEEVRSQQEQIVALAEGYDVLQHHHEHMLSILPVPVLTTDRHGVIRGANTAAAAFLRMRPGRLIGKPALSFVVPDDRRELRTILAGGLRDEGPVRSVVSVMPREDRAVTVEITLTRTRPSMVTWMLLIPTADAAPVMRSLPEALAALSALPATRPDLDAALKDAVELIADALGSGVTASIAVGDPLGPRAVATSSALAQRLDGAQVTCGQGPCPTAFDTGRLVESVELATDDRWPRLPQHVPAAVGAVSVPLHTSGAPFGCLNVYSAGERLEAALVQSCELFAATVSAIVHEYDWRDELATLSSGLKQALASRAVIEQAKGIVMAARRCDADQAFAHLVDLSSTQHLKLREVARRIVSGTAED